MTALSRPRDKRITQVGTFAVSKTQAINARSIFFVFVAAFFTLVQLLNIAVNYKVGLASTDGYTADGLFGQVDYSASGDNCFNGSAYLRDSIIDEVNHRALIFAKNVVNIYQLDSNNQFTACPPVATLGLGVDEGSSSTTPQANNFGSEDPDTQSVSSTLAYDAARQYLYVPDCAHGRVMVFDLSGNVTSQMNASWVIGAPNFTTNGTGCVTAVAYDTVEKDVYVAQGIHVNVYDTSAGVSTNMAASHILGTTHDDLTPSASGFGFTGTQGSDPNKATYVSLYFDSNRRELFLGDSPMSRVLVFDMSAGVSDYMNASHVLGKTSFTDNSNAMVSNPGTSNYPFGIATQGDRLIVSTNIGTAAFVYDLSNGITDGMPATGVFGRPDFNIDFSAIPVDNVHMYPVAFATYTDPAKGLWALDHLNSRMMHFSFVTLGNYIPNSSTVGVPYSSSGSPSTGSQGTLSYAIIGGSLPDGLSLNTSNGFVSGTPTTPGNYNFQIRATDQNGASGYFTDSKTYAMAVSGDAVEPPITPVTPVTPTTPETPSFPTPTSQPTPVGPSAPSSNTTKLAVPTEATNYYQTFQPDQTVKADEVSLKQRIQSVPQVIARIIPYFLFLLILALIIFYLYQLRHEIKNNRRIWERMRYQEILVGEKRSFLQLVSHYLRTPMTIINGGIELAESEMDPAEHQALSTQAKQLSLIVEEIIQSTKDNKTFRALDLTPQYTEPKWSILKKPIFWVPTSALAILMISYYIVFLIVGDVSLLTINIISQVVLGLVVVAALYTAVHNRTVITQEHDRIRALAGFQESLDTVRTDFAYQTHDSLNLAVQRLRDRVKAMNDTNPSKVYVLNGLQRFTELLASLALTSKLEAKELTEQMDVVKLDSLIAQAVESYQGQLQAKQLSFKVAPIPPTLQVKVIPSLMLLTLRTLLDNAIKASQTGDTISLKCSTHKNRILLQIIDEGIGMSEDEQVEVFKPFGRIEAGTTSDGQGLGLSLYTDRMIMHAFGGELSLESVAKKGTIVSLELPGTV